jgi:hypothetical protein
MYARVLGTILVVATVEVFVVGFGGRWLLLAGVPVPYALLVVLSFVVYGSSGYLVAGFASNRLSALAGGTVAVIDAVVWAAIGAPDVDPSVSLDPSPLDLTFTLLMMAPIGGVMGLLGGATARWRARLSRRSSSEGGA